MGTKVYDPKIHPRLAKSLYKRGFTDADVADEFGVSTKAIYLWVEKYPDFCSARKEGKEHPTAKVHDAFLKSCVGYDYEEVEMKPVNEPLPKNIKKDGKPKKGGTTAGRPPKQKYEVVKITRRHQAPNVSAQEFYLTNNLKERYKNKQDLEIKSDVTTANINMTAAEMTPEQRLEWLRKHGWEKSSRKE